MHIAYGRPPGQAAPGHSESTRKEKTAEVLDTLATVSKEQSPASLTASEKRKQIQYAKLQAAFNHLGRHLAPIQRRQGGHIVTRLGESRYFGSTAVVKKHLREIGGRP